MNLSKFELLVVEGDHVRGLAQPVRGRKGEGRERKGRGRRRREEGEREERGRRRGQREVKERETREGGKIRETQMKYPTSSRLRDLSTLSLSQDWGVARRRIHN